MHATFVLYWRDILWSENCFTKLHGFSVYFRSIPVLWYLVMQMGSWLYGNGKTPEYTPGSKSMTQCVLVACGYPTRLQKWSHADGTVQSNSGINHTTIFVLNCLSLFFSVVKISLSSIAIVYKCTFHPYLLWHGLHYIVVNAHFQTQLLSPKIVSSK